MEDEYQAEPQIRPKGIKMNIAGQFSLGKKEE
jgi:hypothetical protein